MEEFIRSMEHYAATPWDKLPDLELYMDQVITYLKRQLALFQDTPEDNLITPSIINNYVKGGFVPRPRKKRYAKEHIAALTMACTLKRVMPMQRVKELIEGDGQMMDGALYDDFCAAQSAIMGEEAERLRERLEGGRPDREALYKLAMRYAMRANADRLIAEKLLAGLDEGQANGKGPSA